MGNKVNGIKRKLKRKGRNDDERIKKIPDVQETKIPDVQETKIPDVQETKILLLGTGGSGKSTIFKQLRHLYGESLCIEERRTYKQYVYEQCITEMKHALVTLNDFQDETNVFHDLVTQNYQKYIINEHEVMLLVFGYTREFRGKLRSESSSMRIPDEISMEIFQFVYAEPSFPGLSDQGMEYAEYIQGLPNTTDSLNGEIINALQELWKEPAIKQMYDLRNITGIEDSTEYFWNGLDTIGDPMYDLNDTLLVRKRTTGVHEMKIRGRNKSVLRIVDVGGASAERRKWINCFDALDAVIFVASLSCYDEVLFEDSSVNGMTDQLELFDEVVNFQYPCKTTMILFLNKKDLFAEKIKRVPLSKCKSFATYRGDPRCFDQTTKYIREAFCSLNQNAAQRDIFTHITCATDTNNVQKVFADVQRVVVEASLIQAGPTN